jgi:serine phosphatase RsbU (regulator of sigma subunit)
LILFLIVRLGGWMGFRIDARLYDWAGYLTRHPVRVAALGLLVDVATAAAAWVNHLTPVTIPALVSLLVAVFSGRVAGVVVALGGALPLTALVIDTVHPLSARVAVATGLLWIGVAYLAGGVAQSLRAQVTQRQRDLSDALQQAEGARAHADELHRVLDHILTLTPTLHLARDYADVARAACEAGRQTFETAGCALYELEAGTLRLVASAAATPPPAVIERIAGGSTAGNKDAARILTLEQAVAVLPELEPVLRGLSAGSAVLVSSRPNDELDLLLLLWWEEAGLPLDSPRRAAYLQFADQVTLAFSRVRTEAVHRRLETGLLPTLGLTHPVLAVEHRYRLGERRLGLGGDFFDVMVRDDGRLDLVIGDVTGYGADAAALGTTLRSGWRALRSAEVPLADVALALDRVTRHERADSSTFATCIAATISAKADAFKAVSCGHPPPLLMTESVSRLEMPPFPPLGFLGVLQPQETSTQLPARWAMLLYTDGLIEGRAAPESRERYGEERLTSRLNEELPGLAEGGLLRRLFHDIETANGGELEDDVLGLLVTASGEPILSRAVALSLS